MEIRKVEKSEPKYPKIKKGLAVAAAAVALTASLGGCKPEIVGKETAYDPSLDESGDVAEVQLPDDLDDEEDFGLGGAAQLPAN